MVIQEDELPSSELIFSNFNSMASKIESGKQSGIVISGSNVTIINSTVLNNKFGIKLGGESNKIIDTKIKMERNSIPDSDISGIFIAGRNHWIENSEIKGYISSNENQASDISVSNEEKLKKVISAKIINTRLLDPLPIYFGSPTNENSFLEIYGYNAPFAQTRQLPENFILKKIGTDTIEERGEYNNLEFDAMIKMIPKEEHEKQLDTNDESLKSELIKNFKNKALSWEKNQLTNQEFLNEIEILFESRILEIEGVEDDTFQEKKFVLLQWIKKLVGFWSENSISDQEFINAIKYVLELQINKVSY